MHKVQTVLVYKGHFHVHANRPTSNHRCIQLSFNDHRFSDFCISDCSCIYYWFNEFLSSNEFGACRCSEALCKDSAYQLRSNAISVMAHLH